MISGITKQGVNKVLFDFSVFFDMKIGFVKYIASRFKGSSLLDEEFLKSTDDEILKIVHIYSNTEDIICRCFKDKDVKSSAYSLFEEVKKDDYITLINLSPTTSMVKLFKAFHTYADGAVKATVFCKNQTEVQYIKRLFNDIEKPDIVTKIDNIRDYGRVILSYINDINYLDNVIGMNIMYLNYRENFEEKSPTQLKTRVIIDYGDNNNFTFADAYINLQEPESGEEIEDNNIGGNYEDYNDQRD